MDSLVAPRVRDLGIQPAVLWTSHKLPLMRCLPDPK